MEIILSSIAPERVECDAVVLTIFQDERPLRGLSGQIDWRLHGFISKAIMNNVITGVLGEKTLIASNNLVCAPKILCVGLGEGRKFSVSRFQEICALILRTLAGIRVFTFAASLPGVESLGWNYSDAAEWLVNGTVAWAKEEGDKKVPFRLILLERKNVFDAIILGFNRSILKHRKFVELNVSAGELS